MTDEWRDPERIETEIVDRKQEWLDILTGLIRTPSVNPPGDTTEIADFLVDVFVRNGVPYDIVAPNEDIPNVVAQFGDGTVGSDESPHLVFNGHLDTYPVGDGDSWEYDPFSGTVEDGRIHGRGAGDMHGGFVATLAAFLYLFEHREAFEGTVTYAAVGDEETGGEWGTQYLVANHPEYTGDAVLSGEPTAGLIRFAERGPVWIDLHVRGESAHSAYPEGLNAIHVLIDSLHRMRTDTGLDGVTDVPETVREAIEGNREAFEARYGDGSVDAVLSPSVSVGTITGGEKINLTAETARAEVDIRLPVGTATDDALTWVEGILEASPGDVSAECVSRTEPTYTDPEAALVRSIQRWAGWVRDRESNHPPLACGFGFNDCRFYRLGGVPSVCYGPTAYGLGGRNEYITVREFLESAVVHTLTAVDVVTPEGPTG